MLSLRSATIVVVYLALLAAATDITTQYVTETITTTVKGGDHRPTVTSFVTVTQTETVTIISVPATTTTNIVTATQTVSLTEATSTRIMVKTITRTETIPVTQTMTTNLTAVVTSTQAVNQTVSLTETIPVTRYTTVTKTTLVTPSPSPSKDPIPPRPNPCTTGTLQCCNLLQKAISPAMAGVLTLFGQPLGTVTGLVGVTCLPLSISTGCNACSAQTVCCTNNTFNGVVALGCNPVKINL